MAFTWPPRRPTSEQCPDCGHWLANRAALRRHRGRPRCTVELNRRRLRARGFVHNAKFGPPGFWLTGWDGNLDVLWPPGHRLAEPVGYQVQNYHGSWFVMAWWLRAPEPGIDVADACRWAPEPPRELRHLDIGTWDLSVRAIDVHGDDHVDLEVIDGSETERVRIGRRHVWSLDGACKVSRADEGGLAPLARRFLEACRDAPGFLALEPLHAYRWLEEGFPPMEAVRWTRCATSIPTEAADWRDHDISPVAARCWMDRGVIDPGVVWHDRQATDPDLPSWRERFHAVAEDNRRRREEALEHWRRTKKILASSPT